MRRLIVLFFSVFLLSGVAFAQQMSDEHVVQYVKDAQKTGKSQKQITTELLRQGVTREQVERIKNKYEQSQSDSQDVQSIEKSRQRERGILVDGNSKVIKGLRKSSGEQVTTNDLTKEYSEENQSLVSDVYPMANSSSAKQIFGHNIFTNRNLTFEPNINVPSPVNYHLGPGDEVIIDVWGASETTIRDVISPEGSIFIKNLGPLYLSGKTVKEANSYVKQELSKIYNAASTQVKLTVGEIRSIQVNIMGEVATPGTYTISSFSSVFHALYSAGGVNKIGSLRDIKVVRNGKVIANLDVYDFIMKGKMNDDVRLQDGDVLIVNPYESLVQILGKVKRPMFYEMKPTETVATILKYAGSFTGDAYKKAVRIIRKSGREYQVYNVDEMDYSVFRLDDGDVVTVDSVLNRFENRVELRGAVYRPGLYQLDGAVNTVKLLIKKADGIRGDAFMNRAVINRQREDLTYEIIPIDLKGLLDGTVADIPLLKNDILYIPSIHDLEEQPTVAIHGEVASPGTYLYADNMSIEDLVLQSGGLLETAATTRVEVARRVKDPKSAVLSKTIGKNFTFDLKDGLLVGENSKGFHLQPFDEIYIRRSPAYHEQQNVIVNGEVLFSGSYALSKKNERLSDLIAKAGGVTPDAYVEGARLIRKMTEEEVRRKEDALRMAQSGGEDSISVKKLDLSDTYSVGISLDEALAKPGSDYDMVLRDGDMLFIPEYVSTVKINGAVMYPNTVLYKRGKPLKYYINQAGGYGSGARKRKAYVVYMNGTVSRLRTGNTKAIEPGCEIIVPSKDKKRMSTAEIIGMGTSAAALATMIATLVNLFK